MKRRHLCLAGYSLVAAAAFGCSRGPGLVSPAPTVVQASSDVQQQVAAAWEADRAGESERALAMYLEVLSADPGNAWAKRRVEQLSINFPTQSQQMLAQAEQSSADTAEIKTVAAEKAVEATTEAESNVRPAKSNPFEDWAFASKEKPEVKVETSAIESKPATGEAFPWAGKTDAVVASKATETRSVNRGVDTVDDEKLFEAAEQQANPFEAFVAADATAFETEPAEKPETSIPEETFARAEPKIEEQPAPAPAAKVFLEDTIASATDSEQKPFADGAVQTVAFGDSSGAKDVIAKASGSLVELCTDANVQVLSLVHQLESPIASQRREALHELGLLGRTAQTARLPVRILFDDSSDVVSAEAAWTMWQIEQDSFQSVRRLATLVRSQDEDAADLAIQSLGLIGKDAVAAAPMLRSQLNSSSGVRRVRVAEALLRIQPEDVGALQSLIESTRYGRDAERAEATFALAHTPSVHLDKVTPVLVNALHDEDEAVRTAAALTLGGFGKGADTARLALEAAARFDTRPVRDAARASLACLPE